MKAEIITIGDEILIGQIINTNSSWLADQLVNNGIECTKISTVGDNSESIKNALTNLDKETELTIITGGLGPTNDDITKKVLCNVFEDDLILNNQVLNDITDFFKRKKRSKILGLNKNQALVPSKAKIIRNSMGTAPGIWFKKNNKNILALPGVPYEMKHLFKDFLKIFKSQNKLKTITNKTIFIKNIPESQIANMIKEWESNLNDKIKLAYLPRPGTVRLRLSIIGNNQKKQLSIIEDELRKLENYIEFSEGDIDLNILVHDLLIESSFTISVAESCSSGFIASELTSISGSSSYFRGGIIAYNDEIKVNILDINKDTIIKESSVSSTVAELMAKNVAKRFNTDFAISTTGYASSSLQNTSPVGTVFIAVKTPMKTIVKQFLFSGSRKIIIDQVKDKAFEMLIEEIKKIK